MLRRWLVGCMAAALVWLTGPGPALSAGLPANYRIALNMDGNYNDYDDFGASPVSMAIIKAFGAQNRVVHVSYNNILGSAYQIPYMVTSHTDSVNGAVSRYGIDAAVVFSATLQPSGAINTTARDHLRNQINASSASNRLFIYAAGPMEFLYQALAAANANRQYVTILSHSSWNNVFSSAACCIGNPAHPHDVWDILALSPAPKWIQVRQQFGLDSANVAPNKVVPVADARWNPWRFLNSSDSAGGNANNRWIWDRLVNYEFRPDTSDSGIMYFLFTGFEYPVPDASSTWPSTFQPAGASNTHTLRRLIEDGIVPVAVDRTNVRFETELLKWSNVAWVKWPYGSGVSQQGTAKNGGANGSTAKMWGKFDQLHSQSGTYTVRIRYYDEPGGACSYRFYAGGSGTGASGGVQYGATWNASANPAKASWALRSITGVPVTLNTTEFRVQATRPASGSEVCQVDYVEFQKQ